jgi:hypothetical protein
VVNETIKKEVTNMVLNKKNITLINSIMIIAEQKNIFLNRADIENMSKQKAEQLFYDLRVK